MQPEGDNSSATTAFEETCAQERCAPENDAPPAYEYTTFPRRFISYRWFKPLLVALLTFVFMLLFQIVTLIIATAWAGDIDFIFTIGTTYDDMNPYTGPGAMVELGSIAVILPALALAALIVRDRPYSSYSSSRGGWNWKAFGKCLLVALVVVALPSIIELFLFPDEGATGIVKLTVPGVIACIAIIPFQCAAEEYVFRGLIMQTVGSWTKLPVLAILVQAAVFAAAHPYNMIGVIAIFLNGVVWGIVVQQTKGLEASCAAHIVNNFMAFGLGGLGLASITSEVDVISLVIALAIDLVYLAVILVAHKKLNWFASKGDGAAAFNEKRRAKMALKQAVPQTPET